MSWEAVSDAEVPKMIAAMKDHRCVTCYEPVEPYDGGLYCHACDPREPEAQDGETDGEA